MQLKNFTLSLIAGILSINAFSQPTITKQKDIGGTRDDDFTCMDATKDGGYILGGYSYSNISGNKTENSKGFEDYWVIKMDSLQHIQWDKTIGGNDGDDLKSIQQTSDGGYILGGYSYSNASGDKSQDSKGADDYWVVKLDSLGNIQWDKTIGGNSYDNLSSIQQTSDGGYILGGTSSSNASGDKTENNYGKRDDYWIVKLNKLGHIVWDKTIGGNDYERLDAIQQTSDGGYILGGESISGISGVKTQHSKGGYDYWVVKLNNAGNIQWDKTIGGNFSDYLQSIRQTTDGGYILGGYSASNKSGDKTEDSRGSDDYWVVKLNNAGNFQWDKTIGGGNHDILYSVNQTKDEGYILGGYSYSNKSGDKTEDSKGFKDYWVVKVDKNGIIEWDKTIGGSDDDVLFTIKESIKNKYVLGGTSDSKKSGNKTKALIGSNDYWIVYLEYKNSNAKIISSSNKISLQTIATSKNFSTYPNPVKDILYVQSKSKTNFSLTDQSGKTIITKTIEGNGKINVADFIPGLYYLKNEETGISQKIIVAR